MESAPEKIAKLREAFTELKDLRGNLSVEWSDLESEFEGKQANASQRYEELFAKERTLESQTRELLESIAQREAVVAERESKLQALEQQSNAIQPMDTDIADSKGDANGVERPEIRVRPYLKSLCENMEGEGLRKYIFENRKDMGALRAEIPSALQHATDPARLVLDAVQGYYQPENLTEDNKKETVTNSANKRVCLLLLEALSTLLGDDQPSVPADIKLLVRELAEQWKSKMDVQDAPDGNSLDAQAFLQLLAAYGLGSEYDEEELMKLVLAIARRKQTPAICKALNLSHKIPDILEQLTNDGKQIEALTFAHAFDMMGRVEPVPLLKAYLKDARKNFNKGGGQNNNQNDYVAKELSALKNVIKCIEDYHLEAEYPPSPLHKRVAHLERTRSERKRTGGAVKGQSKRARNTGYDRNFYRPSDQPQVYNGVPISPYSMNPQTPYDTRRYSTYPSPGAARSRTPGSPYLYSVETAVYGSGNLYGTQSASYSNYQLAPGLPPPQPYQAAYMH